MRNILMLAVALALTTTLHAASVVPLGHPDFYPSPERPVGWRGDGTGAWPGAKCVTNWNSETGENIVWKTNTPGAGLCQPIVVGEKVFITADPNWLLCYNIHDGKLLWQTAIDHTLKMSPEDREKARAEQTYFDDLWKQYQRWHKGYDGLMAALLAKSASAATPASAKDGASKASPKTSESDRSLRATWEVPDQQSKRLPKPEDPQGKALLATIGSDKQLEQQYRALLTEQEEFSWVKHMGTPAAMNTRMHTATPKTAWYSRYLVAQEKYDLWFTANNYWIAWTTYSFSTPISDGKYIYVTTANNAVAAVDLDGKIAWLVWEQLAAKPPRNLGTTYCPSPLLFKGKLIVHNRCHLRVYDAASGRKLWEEIDPTAVSREGSKKAKQKSTYNWRSPEAWSPNATTLTLPDGSQMDVLLEGWETIWRLDDGRLLCKDLPFRGPATSITKGDVLMFGTPGGVPKGISLGGAIRLKAVSRDRVETEVLWSSREKMISHCTAVFVDGKFIAQIGGTPAVEHDPLTGKTQPLLAGKPLGTGGGSSPIVAGQRIYCFLGPSTISNPVFGCKVGDFEAKTVTTVGTAIIDDRYLRDDEFGLINYGIPCGYQQNSSPSAQANRIFFRSRGILWCIGDKTQPFPVPKDCPAEARVSR